MEHDGEIDHESGAVYLEQEPSLVPPVDLFVFGEELLFHEQRIGFSVMTWLFLVEGLVYVLLLHA